MMLLAFWSSLKDINDGILKPQNTWTVGFNEMNEFKWSEIANEGLNTIHHKTIIDKDSFIETAKWMIQAREKLGSNIVVGIDYHHRLSVAEAASFCQKLPTGTLDFIEEPIRDESPGCLLYTSDAADE